MNKGTSNPLGNIFDMMGIESDLDRLKREWATECMPTCTFEQFLVAPEYWKSKAESERGKS